MFDGIVPVWKEKGMTSHDVVFKMRKIFKMKKVGHTGTLDPEVDGILVVCLGQGTKLVDILMNGKKQYQGEIAVGIATTTEDAHGEVIKVVEVQEPIPSSVIDDVMKDMEGELAQVPPYYSAVKVKGKRLYEYARAGQEVERPKRRVQIEKFRRTSDPFYDPEQKIQKWNFEVECGKGTYVRTLAVDCCVKLGYPGHMSQLTRTASAGFNNKEAFTLRELEQLAKASNLNEAVIPLEKAIEGLPRINLTKDQFQEIRHGAVVVNDYFNQKISKATALFFEDKLRAIYDRHPSKDDKLKPYKMFPREKVEK
ncbi:tRNA pseudouridine(55) synthase TruB [Facklamia lactis]|uniref:tRNA pseudouridine(55) synthase TruB n=1 Tax=Facklamia lactis TaxID=2749967 RepID=UPI0018CEBD09|nr:tRNA pseudouridine(55) synthase TruB [Facklamia lactis]MBG9980018.1 tRNA pseudouridine(55) synthase TruB [Facklamia lactis]